MAVACCEGKTLEAEVLRIIIGVISPEAAVVPFWKSLAPSIRTEELQAKQQTGWEYRSTPSENRLPTALLGT